MNNLNPLIFTKKVNNKYKTIPINLIVNTSGPVKHFPPATQEWFNSIYTYNKNSLKNISIADKNLSRLIKSYFNFYFSQEIIKSKRIAMRFRRLATRKIFVSKADVKHTNDKVIITLYVYNQEKRYLDRNVKKLAYTIFPSDIILFYKNLWRKKLPLGYAIRVSAWLYEYYHISLLNWFSNNASYYFKQLQLERERFSNIKKKKAHQKKINLENRQKLLKGLEEWIDISILTLKKPGIYNKLNIIYSSFLFLVHVGKQYKIIKYYKTLLKLNNAKFNSFFIEKLKPLVCNIYNKKEIHFNIVNLKTLYLNSDIFTQVIALKLRNRDNKLIRVLRSALYLVKLPKVNIIKERYHKIIISKIWENRIKNLKVNSFITGLIVSPEYNNEILNNALSRLFSDSTFLNNGVKSINNISFIKPAINKNTSLLNFLLKSLKHKNMAGVRLEAKGRLTRRFTASRSVFKIKWKGGIRNIDSSYRGLSTVMLRGHVTSNLQYSIINSKTRNGAFGVKGWIGSK